MTCHSERYDLTSCHWLKLRSLASFEARIDFLPFTSSSSSSFPWFWSPPASPSPTISSRSSVCVDFTAWLPLQLIPRPNRSWKNEGKMRITTPIQTNPPSQLHCSLQGVPKKVISTVRQHPVDQCLSINVKIYSWYSICYCLVHCKHKVLWYHSPGIIASPSAKQRSIWESWWLRRRVRSNDNIGPGSGMDALRTKCAKLIWKVFMKMSLCLLCLCELFLCLYMIKSC